jgi:hypothetical protein
MMDDTDNHAAARADDATAISRWNNEGGAFNRAERLLASSAGGVAPDLGDDQWLPDIAQNALG